MDTGTKIKLTRKIRGLTQKGLAEIVGTNEVMIRKYEIGKGKPRDEQLQKIADALGVNINVLREFEINTDRDAIPLLFEIDRALPITLKEVDGKYGLFFDDFSMNLTLRDWASMKELVASGDQSQENYDIWRTIRPGITKVVSEDDL